MNLIDTSSLVVTPNGYKATKLYAPIPTSGAGDLTFSRTGDTATRVNSNGLIESVLADKPRLDYFDGTCPKLLLEPQRTNLALYSSDFTNAAWTGRNITPEADLVASPDGTTNADKIKEDTSNSYHDIYTGAGFSITSGNKYTISCFVKAAERTECYMWWGTGQVSNGTTRMYFDLVNGVALNSVALITTKIEDYGSGWFRISITGVAGTNGTAYLFTGPAIGQTFSYQGVSGSGIYVWGAQAEASAFPTSYIPTTSATVTRNVDACSKTSATALIGQTEGTIFLDVNLDTRVSNTYIPLLTDTTLNNYVGIKVTDTAFLFEVVSGGVTTCSINSSNTATGHFKFAATYKLNDFAFYINGALIGSDTSGAVPVSLTKIENLYYNDSNIIKLNALVLWTSKQSSDDLISLTQI